MIEKTCCRWIPAALALVGLVFPHPSRGAELAAPEGVELQFLNGSYTDLDSDLEPVRQGPLVIRISSPNHQVRVHRNRFELTPRDDGLLDAILEVDFEGDGLLFADIEGPGISSRYTDEVAAPRQTVRVAGKIRLEQAEGGYLVTVEEAPPSVDLEIRSAMAQRIVDICRTLAQLPLLRFDCTGLEASMSVATVPLPEPGEQFLVPEDRLTEAERAFFDRFAAPGSALLPVPTALTATQASRFLYTWRLTGNHEGMPKPGAATRYP